MSRFLELRLHEPFKDFVGYFQEAFPFAHSRYRAGPADFYDNLEKYSNLIDTNANEIFRSAATDIGTYVNLYGIAIMASADEYKIIYFLGRAIETHLRTAGLVEIAQIHMYTMIGLLDFRLKTLGIDKPQLTRAMTSLVRVNKFGGELGRAGCYLIYKCVSTTPKGNDLL